MDKGDGVRGGLKPVIKHARFVHLDRDEQFPVVLVLNDRQQRFTKAAAIELHKELSVYIKEQTP